MENAANRLLGGRPRAFDEAAVLDAAIRVFWRRGYASVSVQEIEAQMGLSRSSLYNAFGSKRDLYLKALRRYQERLGAVMFEPLENGTRGLDDLHAFFDRLAGGLGPLLGEDDLPGCLIVNSMAEFAGEDTDIASFGLELFSRLRHATVGTLERSARAGEIAGGHEVSRARLVVTIATGINVKIRAGESPEDLTELITAAHELIDSWRIAGPGGLPDPA